MHESESPRSDFLYAKGPYLYFRFPKRFKVKPVGIPADQTSPAFKRAYDRCLATLRKLEAESAPLTAERPAVKRAEFGTIAKAVELYMTLPQSSWHKCKPKSQRTYYSVIKRIKAEIGDGELRSLDRDMVEELRDSMFASDSMADLFVTLINNVWETVRKDEQFATRKLPNPTLEVERRRKESDKVPHLKWSEDAQDVFMATAPPHLRLAKDVLHFTVQRGGDAVRIKWSDYDGRGVKIWPEKTTAKDVVLDPEYHLLPDYLIEVLDAAKLDATGETILAHSWGKPWSSSKTLSRAIVNHFVKIGVRQKGQKKGLTMHGLRHTGASEVAAIPGIGIKGIKSLGWKSDRMAMKYAEQADKERINAQTIEAWNAEIDRKHKLQAAARQAKRASLKVVK